VVLGWLVRAALLLVVLLDMHASGAPVCAAEHDRILGKGAKATARQQALARARTSSLGVAYSLSLAPELCSAVTGHACLYGKAVERCLAACAGGMWGSTHMSHCGAGMC
jgi:hypothetical protein